MKKEWSSHLSRQQNSLLADKGAHGCSQTFPLTMSSGKVPSSFASFSALQPGQSQSYLLRNSACITGFCIHGNACFTYHFISNNGKLNIWCEAMSGFRLEDGGGGEVVSPKGNLSDGIPNAMHLKKGVDWKTPCSVACMKNASHCPFPSAFPALACWLHLRM